MILYFSLHVGVQGRIVRSKATKSMDLLSLKRAFVRYVSHEIRFVSVMIVWQYIWMSVAVVTTFCIVLCTKVPVERRALWHRFSSWRDSAEHVVLGERRGYAGGHILLQRVRYIHIERPAGVRKA